MVIEKVINNNVISSRDADNNEIIVMGRGIGFQKKPGQAVNERHVEKVFRLENSDVREQFKNLLESMPLEYIQVSADIISYAKKKLNTKLSQNVYLTLTDHIAFAIERFKKDILEENKSSRIYTNFLNYKEKEYLEKTSTERKVIDFLAGMTDEYFLKCSKD